MPRLCSPPSSSGGSSQLNPVWQPDRSKVLVLFGTNPVVSHGYGTTLADPVTRLRRFRRNGGQVWVLDPRRTETAAFADRHLQLRAGTDHLVMAWLVRELLDDGADVTEIERACRPEDVERTTSGVAPFTLDRVAAGTGLAPDDLESLLAVVRTAPGGVAAMAGTGVMMSTHGLVAEWLRWALLIVTGSLDRGGAHAGQRRDAVPSRRSAEGTGARRPTPAGPRSRPELSGWAGQYPCVAMADEIRTGHLRALVVIGGSPLTAFPDPARTRRRPCLARHAGRPRRRRDSPHRDGQPCAPGHRAARTRRPVDARERGLPQRHVLHTRRGGPWGRTAPGVVGARPAGPTPGRRRPRRRPRSRCPRRRRRVAGAGPGSAGPLRRDRGQRPSRHDEHPDGRLDPRPGAPRRPLAPRSRRARSDGCERSPDPTTPPDLRADPAAPGPRGECHRLRADRRRPGRGPPARSPRASTTATPYACARAHGSVMGASFRRRRSPGAPSP